MGSVRSSVEDSFGGFDINSAAVDFEHQESSTRAPLMAAKSTEIHLHFLLHLLLPLTSLPSKASSQSTTAYEHEKRTLLRIKNDWGNPPPLDTWTDSSAAAPHCNWTGIQCSGGSVTEISLHNQNLTEPIPAAICDLKNLSLLDLSYNNLPGPFPTTIYNCSALSYLDLSQNRFVGGIPSDVHRLSPGLTYLSLSANNFTGDIPPSIGRLPAVQSLLLDNNLFNGSFPAEIGNLSTLQTLWLAYNPFSPASIPPGFGNLTEITFIWMAQMNLVGDIPESLANLSQLTQLDLSMNSLTGRIPSGIWMLEKLQYLYLYKNHLAGEINGTIGALGLVYIDVSLNLLSGSIPLGFGNLRNLQGLAMYYNRLSGEIPPSIGVLPALTNIRLFNNNLTGVLPPELGKHSKLWNLEVDDNHISGEMPEYLCAGQVLTSVVVFDNNLTGKLPSSLGNCPTLDNLQLHKNGFSGDVPSGIWSAVNLTTVIIHHNALSGALPDKLTWNLTRLEIGNNRFSGSIPSSAGNLRVFTAENNLFSGEIPAKLAGISRLQILSLGGNMITGPIPTEISSLRSLTELNLRDNRLSGEIPAAIGSLPVLTSLDLSGNQLYGAIPPAIGDLKLNSLNLSSNQLSGEIPAPLQNQAYDRSFLSNPSLCSSNSLLNLHACGSKSVGSNNFFTGSLILFLLLGAFLLSVAAVLGFILAREYRRRRKDGADLASWKLTSFHAVDFTESNIVKGLTEENLIGSGGSGRVYRVAFGSRAGEIVAVKKIWNSRKLDSKLEKEFQAEVQILGSIRHTNIVKLLCCVSSADSKLLVYEHMGNGSLDQWLHRRRRAPATGSGRSAPLDWPTRLGIAVGAARGLCYMHHDCSPPIIHRDVKSSNILLDSEFGAKIADFGLARMLVKSGEPDSVSGIAGSFGYMAPECGYLRKVNEKVDVYSFGVVLLELVTGKEANDSRDEECLAEWAWKYLQEGGKVTDAIIDEELMRSGLFYLEEIEVVLKLGLICTGSLPSSRPSMKEVLQVLLSCGPTVPGGGNSKFYRGNEVVPLLQAKRGSRRNKSSDCGDNGDDISSRV